MLLKSKTDVVDLSPRQFQILRLFSEFYDVISSREMEKALKVDRTTVQYYLHGRGDSAGLLGMDVLKMKEGGKMALYGLTPKGVRILRAIVRGGLTFNSSDFVHNRKLRLRGHNIRVKSSTLLSTGFNSPNLSRFQNTRVYQLASWEKFEGRFEGDYFFLSPTFITFQPAARYGDPYMVMLSIFESARQLYRLLEEDNPGLKVEEDYTFVLGQEYAFEKDAFALACVKLNATFSNAEFGIDYSPGPPELEFWDDARAVEAAGKWKNHTEEFVSDVINDRIKVADLRQVPQLASRLENIEGKALPVIAEGMKANLEAKENNLWYSRNIEEHKGVLDDLKKESGAISRALEEINKKLGTTISKNPEELGTTLPKEGGAASDIPAQPKFSKPESRSNISRYSCDRSEGIRAVRLHAGSSEPITNQMSKSTKLGLEHNSVFEMTPQELKDFWERRRKHG